MVLLLLGVLFSTDVSAKKKKYKLKIKGDHPVVYHPYGDGHYRQPVVYRRAGYRSERHRKPVAYNRQKSRGYYQSTARRTTNSSYRRSPVAYRRSNAAYYSGNRSNRGYYVSSRPMAGNWSKVKITQKDGKTEYKYKR